VLATYLPDPQILKCPQDVERNFLVSEGSSYEYASMLGDRPSPRGFAPQRMKEMIENSTPEERSRRTEFTKIVINRVIERGFRLPSFSGRPSQRPSER